MQNPKIHELFTDLSQPETFCRFYVEKLAADEVDRVTNLLHEKIIFMKVK